MEVISHNGITYTKAAILAKEFGYTADYLGQLCRGKKVDARLVGRAWYINKESLVDHRKNRYVTTDNQSPEQPSEENQSKTEDKPETIKEKTTKVAVQPVLQKKTLKALRHAKSLNNSNYISYSADEGPLVPAVQPSTQQVSQPIRITLAESENVPIKTQKGVTTGTKYAPEPIPKVYMAGKVLVTELPDKSSIPVEAVAVPKKTSTIRISGQAPPKPTVQAQPRLDHKLESSPKPLVSKISPRTENSEKLVNTSYIGKKTTPKIVGTTNSATVPVSFAPRSVTTLQTKKPIKKAIKPAVETATRASKGSVVLTFGLLLVGVLSAAILLTIQVEFQTNGEASNTTFTFQTTLIESLLDRY